MSLGDENVYFLFDTPHLIKCTRNNLRHGCLKIAGETIEWSHIQQLYELTHFLKERLVPKLSEHHIYQTRFGNMKVKYAMQVLSSSVSLAILAFISMGCLLGEAIPTANFCQTIDQLFDILNSSVVSLLQTESTKFRFVLSADPNPEKEKKLRGQLDFLKSQLAWIAQWRFDTSRQPHTTRG